MKAAIAVLHILKILKADITKNFNKLSRQGAYSLIICLGSQWWLKLLYKWHYHRFNFIFFNENINHNGKNMKRVSYINIKGWWCYCLCYIIEANTLGLLLLLFIATQNWRPLTAAAAAGYQLFLSFNLLLFFYAWKLQRKININLFNVLAILFFCI